MLIRCALFVVFVSLVFSSSAEAQLFRRFSRTNSVQQYRSNYNAAAYQYTQPSASVAYIPSQQRCGCQGQNQAVNQRNQVASNANSVLNSNRVQYVTYYDPYTRRYFQMPVATQSTLASADSQNGEKQETKSADANALVESDGVKQAGFDAEAGVTANGYSVFQSASKIPSQGNNAAKVETELPYLELAPVSPNTGSGGKSVIESGDLNIDLPALKPAGSGK